MNIQVRLSARTCVQNSPAFHCRLQNGIIAVWNTDDYIVVVAFLGNVWKNDSASW